MIKLPMPAWAFDYNQSYGTYTNVGNTSEYYPSYSSQYMNSYINKATMPAFVRNARTGCCGNGMVFYGYPPAYNMYKELTHVWAMAIPITMGWPIGICTLNISMGIPYPPNFDVIGPTFMMNTCLFIGNDHRLKYGHQYSSTSIPPNMVYDYGIDMTPYMYTPAVQNADPYCGHMYAFTYNTEAEEYELYVDNMNTKLATINKLLMTECVLNYMNSPDYTAGVPQHLENVIYNGYYYTGPGAYMYNYGNVNRQGNVYMSDWYGWINSFNSTTIDAIMQFDWRQMLPVKNNNYYGAFGYCNQLRHIIVPGTLKNIPNYFINGNNLNSVTFQDGVNLISSHAVDCFNSIGCTVNIPKSAHMVGRLAIQGNNINIPKFTRNAPMLNSMFNQYFDGYEYNFYEQPTQLLINDSPLRQLRPTNYMSLSGSIYMPFPSAYCTPENIANDMYNIATGINVQQKQAYITQDGDSYALSWHNIHAEILFDDPNVSRAPHTNAVMFTPYNMTNEGFDVQIRSLEFPSLMAESHCTIINSPFVITNINDSLRCTVIGCTRGDITEIPDIIDNAYFVETVQLSMPYPSGEADPTYQYGAPIIPDITIKVPNKGTYTNGVAYTGMLNLNINTAQVQNMGSHNIHAHDGFVFNTNVGTLKVDPVYDLYVNNVARVVISGKAQGNNHIIINNCNTVIMDALGNINTGSGTTGANQRYFTELVSTGAVKVSHNNIAYGQDFTGVECLNFPFVRAHWSKDYMGNLLENSLTEIVGDEMPNYIFGWHDTQYYPHLNAKLQGIARNLWSYTNWRYVYADWFLNKYNGKSIADVLTGHGRVSGFDNCILPANIYIANCENMSSAIAVYNDTSIYNRPMFFNNCRGSCNFYLSGYQMPPPIVVNHANNINIFTDIDLLPVSHYLHTERSAQWASQILAMNCNIDVLRIHVNSLVSENSALSNVLSSFMFGVDNCNIDTLIVDEPNIFYRFTNCNINRIQYTGCNIRGLLLNNVIINDYIQPILLNATNASHLVGVLVPDADITLQYKIDPEQWDIATSTDVHCNGKLEIDYLCKEAKLPGFTHSVSVHCKELVVKNAHYVGITCDGGWSPTTANYRINRYPDLYSYIYTYNNRPFYACNLQFNVTVVNAYDGYVSIYGPMRSYTAYRTLPTITGFNNAKHFAYILRNLDDGEIVVADNCVIENRSSESLTNVYIRNTGLECATDILVTYKDGSRVRTLPDGFCNLYDYIDTVTLVGNGYSRVLDKNDYLLVPPFATIRPGTADTNAKHFIFAGGMFKVFDAPYTTVRNYGNAYNKFGTAFALTKENCGYNSSYYQTYTCCPPDNGCIYINATPYAVTSSYSYQFIFNSISSGVPVDGVVINGAYNSWTNVYARNMVLLNQTANGPIYMTGSRIYIKDSAAAFRASWASSGVYRTQYSSGVTVLDFSNSTSLNSTYALGNNCIRGCYNLTAILCQVGNKPRYIANNAVLNCNRLEYIEMNYITSPSFRINDDAFKNCPALREVYTPRNTNYIGNGAFNRTGLKRIVVPSTCTFGTNAVPADCQISYY